MKSKLSAILLLITVAATNAAWTPYTSTEFGFTSKFPRPPIDKSFPMPMNITAKFLMSYYEEGAVSIMIFRFPADYNAFLTANNIDKYTILEDAFRAFCNSNMGAFKVVQDSVTKTRTVSRGYKALDVSYVAFFQDEPLYTKGVLFYTADTVFFLQANTDSFEIAAKNLLQLDFKLLPAPSPRQRPVISDADTT